MKNFKTVSSRFILLSCTCLALGACGSTKNTGSINNEVSKIDAALNRAAQEANDPAQSLVIMERLYKRNPQDASAAVKYAKALRMAEYYNRANIVLSPFAQDDKAPSNTKTEYAAIQLAIGNYAAAERYAQKAILSNSEDYDAYHYLGIALDAQSMHKEAERAFRKALDHWQGDPTPIINNLALNLTSQEYLNEALELLEKALAVSPDRTELERNYRIITALKKTKPAKTPKPEPKPKIAPVEKAKVEEVETEEVQAKEAAKTPKKEEKPVQEKVEKKPENKKADTKKEVKKPTPKKASAKPKNITRAEAQKAESQKDLQLNN